MSEVFYIFRRRGCRSRIRSKIEIDWEPQEFTKYNDYSIAELELESLKTSKIFSCLMVGIKEIDDDYII